MASEKLSKGTREFEMFQEYWKLIQKYWIPEEKGSPYWEKLVEEFGRFAEKFKTDFAEELVIAFYNSLQLKYKKMFPIN